MVCFAWHTVVVLILDLCFIAFALLGLVGFGDLLVGLLLLTGCLLSFRCGCFCFGFVF